MTQAVMMQSKTLANKNPNGIDTPTAHGMIAASGELVEIPSALMNP